MSKNHSPENKRVLALAEQEARQLNHAYIGTEHLLLAAIQDETTVGANVLRALGVSPAAVREEVAKLVTPGSAAPPDGQFPVTPRAKLAIEYACEEARFVNCDDCGGGLVLVGLAREPDGVAAQVFRNLGLSLPKIAGEVFKIRVLQMKIVERAVRPIRAGIARKRKMREELLAHLTEIYDEELAQSNDPHAATEQAARRFGDPAELARELEKSLPRHERRTYYFERWVGWRAPETVAKWMLRLAGVIFVLWAIVCTLGTAAALLVGGRDLIDGRFLRGLAGFLVLDAVGMAALGVLFFKLRDAMFGVFGSRKSWTKVLLFQALIALLVPGCGVAYVAFTEWSLVASSEFLIPYTAAGVALLIAARVLARFNGPTEICDTYWACLEINSVCES